MTDGPLLLRLPLDEPSIAAINDLVADKKGETPERWALQRILAGVEAVAADANKVRFGGMVSFTTFRGGLVSSATISKSDLGPEEELVSAGSDGFTLKVGPINKGRIERAYRYMAARTKAAGIPAEFHSPEEYCAVLVREALGNETRTLEAKEGSDELKEDYPEPKKEAPKP